MAYRFALIIALFGIAYAFLGFRIYELQLLKGEYYLAKAQAQSLAGRSAGGERGAIYFTDKDGKTLPAALEKQFPIIAAVPKAISDAAEAAHSVAPLLNMPAADLQKLFSKKNNEYKLLVRKADPAVARKITDLGLKGVYADYAPMR
ncbi:MAG: hypothetical protein Q8P49_03235, partial [Candidatus Liptonbacteria bacterium]|nr:hypothetical protein [Candidatus Liptonbacteria bacterium]